MKCAMERLDLDPEKPKFLLLTQEPRQARSEPPKKPRIGALEETSVEIEEMT